VSTSVGPLALPSLSEKNILILFFCQGMIHGRLMFEEGYRQKGSEVRQPVSQRPGEPDGRLTAVSNPNRSGLASVPPCCGCVAMTITLGVVCENHDVRCERGV
jgi:hypothetical protein